MHFKGPLCDHKMLLSKLHTSVDTHKASLGPVDSSDVVFVSCA